MKISDDQTLHVMSMNIRCDTRKTHSGDPDYWPEREPIITRFLSETQPDVLGVQELQYHQIPSVQNGLSSKYDFFGESRDDSELGEMGPIFYNKERLSLEYWNQLWLSDTPEVPQSVTWGNDVTRIVTWGLFADRITGKHVTIANTHFDHKSEYSRIRSAEMLAELFSGSDPVLLMGDFNADAFADTKERDILTKSFMDTRITARRHLSPCWGTFNDYDDPSTIDTRIDWILGNRKIVAETEMTHVYRPQGRFGTDHLMISAKVSF